MNTPSPPPPPPQTGDIFEMVSMGSGVTSSENGDSVSSSDAATVDSSSDDLASTRVTVTAFAQSSSNVQIHPHREDSIFSVSGAQASSQVEEDENDGGYVDEDKSQTSSDLEVSDTSLINNNNRSKSRRQRRWSDTIRSFSYPSPAPSPFVGDTCSVNDSPFASSPLTPQYDETDTSGHHDSNKHKRKHLSTTSIVVAACSGFALLVCMWGLLSRQPTLCLDEPTDIDEMIQSDGDTGNQNYVSENVVYQTDGNSEYFSIYKPSQIVTRIITIVTTQYNPELHTGDDVSSTAFNEPVNSPNQNYLVSEARTLLKQTFDKIKSKARKLVDTSLDSVAVLLKGGLHAVAKLQNRKESTDIDVDLDT